MATAAVVGLNSGKKMLRTSFYSLDLNEKLFPITPSDHSPKSLLVVSVKKPANFGPNYQSKRDIQAIRALKEHVDVFSFSSPVSSFSSKSNLMEEEDQQQQGEEGGEEDDEGEEDFDVESSLETLILLQKAMLEMQWNLSFNNQALQMETPSKIQKKKTDIVRSGLSARERRSNNTRRQCLNPESGVHHLSLSSSRQNIVSQELLQTRLKGYIRGTTSRKDILSHSEVIHLSKKIKVGLSLEDRRKR